MSISEQDYFDKTIEHLREQGVKAISAHGYCCHLADDGSRCAVGVHIPDGHDAQQAIGRVSAIARRFPELAGVAWPDTADGLRLAAGLQVLHDNIEGSWAGPDERRAQRIAGKHGLTYAAPAVEAGA